MVHHPKNLNIQLLPLVIITILQNRILGFSLDNPYYVLQINFKMTIANNSYSLMKFTNPQMTSFYDRINILYEGYSVNNYTHINIFPTNTTDNLQCYQRFFDYNLKTCHLYFQDSFNNFIINDYSQSQLDLKEGKVSQEEYIIFENSLSKKDLGFYEDVSVKWMNNLNFRQSPFENYANQILLMKTLFVIVSAIQIILFLFLFYHKMELKRMSRQVDNELKQK